MKILLQSALVGLLVAMPAVSFAQSSGQEDTQTDTYVQIIEVDQVFYAPDTTATPDASAPHAAEQCTHTHGCAAAAYGGLASTTSASGASFMPAFDIGLQSIYLRH